MLREVIHARQVPGEPSRRWFTGATTDLVVWYDTAGEVQGFQFCYAKGSDERAATWTRERGLMLQRVDDGEQSGLACKMSPMLQPDESPDLPAAIASFAAHGSALPDGLPIFISDRLHQSGRPSEDPIP